MLRNVFLGPLLEILSAQLGLALDLLPAFEPRDLTGARACVCVMVGGVEVGGVGRGGEGE